MRGCKIHLFWEAVRFPIFILESLEHGDLCWHIVLLLNLRWSCISAWVSHRKQLRNSITESAPILALLHSMRFYLWPTTLLRSEPFCLCPPVDSCPKSGGTRFSSGHQPSCFRCMPLSNCSLVQRAPVHLACFSRDRGGDLLASAADLLVGPPLQILAECFTSTSKAWARDCLLSVSLVASEYCDNLTPDFLPVAFVHSRHDQTSSSICIAILDSTFGQFSEADGYPLSGLSFGKIQRCACVLRHSSSML